MFKLKCMYMYMDFCSPDPCALLKSLCVCHLLSDVWFLFSSETTWSVGINQDMKDVRNAQCKIILSGRKTWMPLKIPLFLKLPALVEILESSFLRLLGQLESEFAKINLVSSSTQSWPGKKHGRHVRFV